MTNSELRQAWKCLHDRLPVEAVAWAKRATCREPGSPESLFTLCHAACASGEVGFARNVVIRAVTLAPKAQMSWHLRAVVAANQAGWENAENNFRRALLILPSAADVTGNLIGYLAQKGGDAIPVTLRERLVCLEPRNLVFFEALADAYARFGNFGKLRALAIEVCRRFPKDPKSHTLASTAWWKLDELDVASRATRRSMMLCPDNLDALVREMAIAAVRAEQARCLALLGRTAACGMLEFPLIQSISIDLTAAGNIKGAQAFLLEWLRIIRKSVIINRDLARALDLLGATGRELLIVGDKACQGAEIYTSAVLLGANLELAGLPEATDTAQAERRALIRRMTQGRKAAVSDLKTWLISKPTNRLALFYLAMLDHAADDFENAAARFRWLRLLAPKCAVVPHRLGHCLTNLGMFDAAAQSYVAGLPAQVPNNWLGKAARAFEQTWSVNPGDPTFSVILCTYKRAEMLRQSVDAILNQTLDDLELIIVNNGGTEDVNAVVEDVRNKDSRVSVLHYKKNQSSPDDPLKYIGVCMNDALREARGRYVFQQSDDDLIDLDYLEKMVRLFEGDANCVVASGSVCKIDNAGRIIGNYDWDNKRPRYVPGVLVTLSQVLYSGPVPRYLYSAYGTTFCFRRDALVRAGGFNRDIDNAFKLGLVPFGTCGLDEGTRFHWRIHDRQYSKELNNSGLQIFRLTHKMLEECSILERWQSMGAGIAETVVQAAVSEIVAMELNMVVRSYNTKVVTDLGFLDLAAQLDPSVVGSKIYRKAEVAIHRHRQAAGMA